MRTALLSMQTCIKCIKPYCSGIVSVCECVICYHLITHREKDFNYVSHVLVVTECKVRWNFRYLNEYFCAKMTIWVILLKKKSLKQMNQRRYKQKNKVHIHRQIGHFCTNKTHMVLYGYVRVRASDGLIKIFCKRLIIFTFLFCVCVRYCKSHKN